MPWRKMVFYCKSGMESWRQLCLKPMSSVCLHQVSSRLTLVTSPCTEVSVYPMPRMQNGYGLWSHWNNTSQELWNCYETGSCDVTGTEAFDKYEILPFSMLKKKKWTSCISKQLDLNHVCLYQTESHTQPSFSHEGYYYIFIILVFL